MSKYYSNACKNEKASNTLSNIKSRSKGDRKYLIDIFGNDMKDKENVVVVVDFLNIWILSGDKGLRIIKISLQYYEKVTNIYDE